MLRPTMPLQSDHLYVSDSDTESDDLNDCLTNVNKYQRGIYLGKKNHPVKTNGKEAIDDGESSRKMDALKIESETMARKAEKYQEYMKQIPIPKMCGGEPFSFISWQELANSMKQRYGQPFHHLTHKLLKLWDQSRMVDNGPLDRIIQPSKAESTIWAIEEIHRQCTSPDHLAQILLSDPSDPDFVDPIIS
ncbi:hypothetical protein Tsubulata_024388 [Turnera subulata]|uniref:Uncharacterized protein n=1 Tax=Turnera subulata TaxID=218843 RepID=A0A9Q0F4Y2_9ROSI|nr:hypothetical protein Tsubulata_024388 [Turnera subulata]